MNQILKYTFVATAIAAGAASALFGAKKDSIKDSEISGIRAALPEKAAATPKKARRALMFSNTCEYRHVFGIPAAKLAMSEMGKKLGTWETDISENPEDFSSENLKKYDFVILNNSTGRCYGASDEDLKKMSEEERAAVLARSDKMLQNLVDFAKNGGGVFAIHAGVDAYRRGDIKDMRFVDMVGGNFLYHPWTIYGAPATIFIEDEESPITKGIWDSPEFKVVEEIYMFGEDFKRDGVRVLMRVNVDNSPITSEFGFNSAIRKDKDVPLAWIKKFGKGRFAYGGFGHDARNYLNPKIQELYLRLAQFAAGDLDADTSPLQMKAAPEKALPLCEKVSTSQIASLKNLARGAKDEEINAIMFAIGANNSDAEYVGKIRKFIFDELSGGQGTDAYREYLAEFLINTNMTSDKCVAAFEKLAASEKNESVKDRILQATTRARIGGKKLDEEKCGKICPKWSDERLAEFLQINKSAEIPARLSDLNALSPNMQTRMIYALSIRNDDKSKTALLSAMPKDEGSLTALAFAASKLGDKTLIERVLDNAGLIKNAKMKPAVAAYILSAPCKNSVEVLREYQIKNAKNRNGTELASLALSMADISYLGKGLFDNFDSKNTAEKIAAYTLAGIIGNTEVFDSAFSAFLCEKDKKARATAKRALIKCVSQNFDDESVKAIAENFDKNPDAFADDVRALLLKILPFNSGKVAVSLCLKIAKTPEDAIESLGKFREEGAAHELVLIAKKADNTRTKTLAQIAMVEVSQREKMHEEVMGYLAYNAVRSQELESAVDLGNKRGSEPFIGFFAKLKPQIEKKLAELKSAEK